MLILFIVRSDNVDDAIDLMVNIEHNNRHTTIIHSTTTLSDLRIQTFSDLYFYPDLASKSNNVVVLEIFGSYFSIHHDIGNLWQSYGGR